MNIDLIGLDIPYAMRKGIISYTKHPISNFMTYEHLSHSVQALVTNLSGVEIPKNVQDAWRNLEWKKAIIAEMQALEENGTWVVIWQPKDKTQMGCKWVFIVKYKADGSIEC